MVNEVQKQITHPSPCGSFKLTSMPTTQAVWKSVIACQKCSNECRTEFI
uniref:Uncharacterized protein n=1 Tax=Anguilla anguilla TaxID=7936 RepID=A0A0E9RH01_ANGAN